MSSDDESENSADSLTLNEEQEAFIKECEEEFTNRYSENDPEYKNLKEAGIGDPPVLSPWYNKPRRNFNWSNARGDSHRHQNYNDSQRRRNYNDSPRHQSYNNRHDNYHSKYKSHRDNHRSRPY